MRLADPAHVAVLEHAQQARLQRELHVADLVEEQRAAVRLLEETRLGDFRIGEGAACVAEQFVFDQMDRESPRS